MDVPQNFRSALNGFRREDVVRYLEYLNARHQTEMNQLNAENESLRQKISELENRPVAPQEDPGLREELETLQDENQSLQERCSKLEQENQEQSEKIEELEDALTTQPATPVPAAEEPRLAEQELEAYRRAERAERVANEKADLVYHRANAILEDASGKIEGASGDLTDLADRLNGQLQQMQYALNSSKLALQSAVETMHSLHLSRD